MLKKIIAIKNVGRFLNSARVPNPQLSKVSLIYGANGFGKTTVCSVLRSLQSRDASHVSGRKTLGITAPISIELLFDEGVISFNGSAWGGAIPHIVIYDGTFIAQNVYSGESVDLDHKRNLYRVIVGAEGMALAEEEARCAAKSRAKTGEITATARIIQTHIPGELKLEQFLALPFEQDINAKIAEQEQKVGAVKQASEVKTRPGLSELQVPAPLDGIGILLSKTIENISDDAEKHLTLHLVSHGMTKANWVADGMLHADKSCPFCGQDLNGLALIAAYRAIFSETYKNFRAEIEAFQKKVEAEFGDAAIGRLTTGIERNKNAVDFWKSYCMLDQAELSAPDSVSEAMKNIRHEALRLLSRKAEAPLERLVVDQVFSDASKVYKPLRDTIDVMNSAVRTATAIIEAKRKETGAADLKAEQAELARLKAVQLRHSEAVGRVCAEYIQQVADKNRLEAEKEAARVKLEAHTKAVVSPYERKINEYLDRFNAGFRIAETKHIYPGGVATSSYRIVINGTPVDLGDSTTPYAQPSFKNTLSGGDRSTLALAFFLAQLDSDANKAQKIVVFDDPFTSQDAFRRRQTIHEICKAGRECSQLIVLSHDVSFLKQVWEKVPAADCTALQITDERMQGTKISGMDLDQASKGRVVSELDDLQTFLATSAGKPLDVIKKMRVVLETHCRVIYPGYFQQVDWLGDIVRKIREGGAAHPGVSLYDDLDQINDYTKQYHHGDDGADDIPDQIDPTELTGFVRQTLRIVNALQG